MSNRSSDRNNGKVPNRFRPRKKSNITDIVIKERQFYLDLIGDFRSMLPPPIVVSYGGIDVVRDDLLGIGGAKTRFAEFLVANSIPDTIVYPSLGYSHICLALVELCKMYDKKLILILPESAKFAMEVTINHDYCLWLQANTNYDIFCYQIRATHFNILTKFAETVAKDLKAALIPLGLKHQAVMASIVKTATDMPEPSSFCVAVGTTMLVNGLQLAWPDAQARGIAIRQAYGPVGRAHVIGSYLWKNRGAKILPPFPSTARVDAKVWEYLKPGDLFWNVTKDL